MIATTELFATAVQLHRMGMPEKAARLCQQIVQQDAQHHPAWHLLGEICYQQRRFPEALQFLQKALQIQPGAAVLFTLGNVWNALGQPQNAVSCFQAACQYQPGFVEAWINLGILFFLQERYRESLDALKEALRLQPDQAAAHFYAGNNYYQLRDYPKALRHYQEVLRIAPDFPDPDFYFQFGNTLKMLKKYDQALPHYQKAIQLRPTMVVAYNNLGSTLTEMGKRREGIDCYRTCLKIDPSHVETHFNLANALKEEGQIDEAVRHYQRAIQLDPGCYQAHYNLGKVLTDQGRLEEGLRHFLRALQLQPAMAAARINAAYLYQELGEAEKALDFLEEGLHRHRQHVEMRWNRSILLLLLGRYAEAWDDYEMRWKRGSLKPRTFTQPVWTGEPLPEGTLLVYCEQGMGDAIQFVRFLPRVRRRVGRLVLECPAALKTLLATIPEIDEPVTFGEPLPHFDRQIALLSLPRIFRTSLETIPNRVPYLGVPPEKRAFMEANLPLSSTTLNVGLVWRGNPRHPKNRDRSCPLDHFAPLASLPGLRLYSLQKETEQGELERVFPGGEVTDVAPLLNDFADTAAAISLLDLVISVDTSVAHLAGALGKPVWILLAYAPDWRWLLHREDSPWYPTARLFRQPGRGDWNTVIQKLQKQLQTLLQIRPTPTQLSAR